MGKIFSSFSCCVGGGVGEVVLVCGQFLFAIRLKTIKIPNITRIIFRRGIFFFAETSVII
jgi:hypothetical protein